MPPWTFGEKCCFEACEALRSEQTATVDMPTSDVAEPPNKHRRHERNSSLERCARGISRPEKNDTVFMSDTIVTNQYEIDLKMLSRNAPQQSRDIPQRIIHHEAPKVTGAVAVEKDNRNEHEASRIAQTTLEREDQHDVPKSCA